MSRKCGIPWMKLDDKTYSSNNEHHGNMKAIMCEAMKERWSSDPDLNRDLTQYNMYGGYSSGLELMNDINHEIEDLSDNLRKQGKRGIRKDAIKSFAIIIKPDKEIMDNLNPEQQIQFFRDAFNIVSEKLGYNKQLNKLNTRAFTIHVDEGNPHMHLFGVPYTEDGRLSAKEIFTPQLSRWFNEEFPKQMNEKGWNLEVCKDINAYDPEYAKTLNEQQLKEYKEQCIEYKKTKKKQHGKKSKEYKENKEIENAVQGAISNVDTVIQQTIQEARQEAYEKAYEEASKVYKAEMEKQLKTAQNKLKSVVAEHTDNLMAFINDTVDEYRKAESARKTAEQTTETVELKETLQHITFKDGKTGLDVHKGRMARKAQIAEQRVLDAERQRKQRISEIQQLEQLSDTEGLTDKQLNRLNSLYHQQMMSEATEVLQQQETKEHSVYQQKILDKLNRQIKRQNRDIDFSL